MEAAFLSHLDSTSSASSGFHRSRFTEYPSPSPQPSGSFLSTPTSPPLLLACFRGKKRAPRLHPPRFKSFTNDALPLGWDCASHSPVGPWLLDCIAPRKKQLLMSPLSSNYRLTRFIFTNQRDRCRAAPHKLANSSLRTTDLSTYLPTYPRQPAQHDDGTTF
ncbi:hypothetical protein LX32DRAFT_646687 [Colletotrichum zoysiae]|uniref:Uncharacterized protein n=1 Tax=Colletotrichum zoysiae TaxID=1216348 RepID=A0AAD9H3H1_9PEZI|nr:hypothetical protein LX32DRAFT_646687 [Colletotrichum zoysiae]